MAKILVIDDDGIVRDALKVFLSRGGHEVITAVDGVYGVLYFKNTSPDLVVLDRDMPGLTGSGVLARIREISSSVPVIILSGYDSPEDVRKYLAAGATAFLSKTAGLAAVTEEAARLLRPGGRRRGKRP